MFKSTPSDQLKVVVSSPGYCMIPPLFTIRRSNANLVYTEKLLKGYQMHGQVCSECEMPMMKYEDSVDCVICPPKVMKVAKMDTTFVETPVEKTKVSFLCPHVLIKRIGNHHLHFQLYKLNS